MGKLGLTGSDIIIGEVLVFSEENLVVSYFSLWEV